MLGGWQAGPMCSESKVFQGTKTKQLLGYHASGPYVLLNPLQFSLKDPHTPSKDGSFAGKYLGPDILLKCR